MDYVRVLVFLLVLWPIGAMAQSATITGIVLDEDKNPLANVNISAGKKGTSTDNNGFYLLEITADRKVNIVFTHIGHKDVILENLILNTNETYPFNPVLITQTLQMDEVIISPQGERKVTGIQTLDTETIRNIPGANAGVENILKLLPGVSSNNELSTQYAVRGGNYDENLVYVNDIEVYRPFLIRSAQQEGLSFVNSAMVRDVVFSAGGFQAKYGDKLSSVLDITYKNPVDFAIQGEVGLLGANATVETLSKNKKVSNVTGGRYRNNALLVNSQQTNTNLRPSFTDVQSFLTYRTTNRLVLQFLGNLSVNNYRNEPLNRQTNFGTIDDPKALLVFYQGRENNRYATALGAAKATLEASDNTTLKFISSIYHTTEEEYSDVIASYALGQVNSNLADDNLGGVTSAIGVGSQRTRARNDLDALIVNMEHRGSSTKGNTLLEWGIKYSHEDIRDQLRESEFIDSAGISIRPIGPEFTNNQPEEPFVAPLVPFTGSQATNFVTTQRLSGFLQMGTQQKWRQTNIYFNIGIRAHHWAVNAAGVGKSSQIVMSPRAQFAIKPLWKRDMLFRASAGWYHQPPFYRELRDITGTINPGVKAQRSFHFVLGNEYSFLLWERPFNLISEVYYKDLDNVNPYTLEDVRIRYAAINNTEAYAYGAEIRLNGAFVPGTESWVSLGFLRTEENQNQRGYIPRPTDQRLKLGILFQDYIPNIPDIKMYLNLVYNTGLPGGSPNDADPYIFQNRLRDYKRADLGISYIFVNGNQEGYVAKQTSPLKHLSFGFEIFNLFNNQNAITNTWVRNVENKNEIAVPNFLTSRVFNLKLQVRL